MCYVGDEFLSRLIKQSTVIVKGKLPVKTSPLLLQLLNRRKSASESSVWEQHVNKHKQHKV